MIIFFNFLIQGLIKSYPDITVDQLTSLFSLREDMNKMNIKRVSLI